MPRIQNLDYSFIDDYLKCPQSSEKLVVKGSMLFTTSGENNYSIDEFGVPLFAEKLCSENARAQQAHYDKIADAYAANLQYPHTLEYMSYLDDELNEVVAGIDLGVSAEVCCGTGEGFQLFKRGIQLGVGLDISASMLHKALTQVDSSTFIFLQGDATNMPLESGRFTSVVMLGGIHHVPDRDALFGEIFRILQPGGVFIWREPVSDFWLWKFLRGLIYRFSPMLDHTTERPLTFEETVPVLQSKGFELKRWQTCGFIGFCLLMNSDVLFFNRFFRFVPGIRKITKLFTRLDRWCTRLPMFKHAGLQVIGLAQKPTNKAG